MNNREKLEIIRNAQHYEDEMEKLLMTIIKSTFDPLCRGVDSFCVNADDIHVSYWWSTRGESVDEAVRIPIEWLDEGFNYVAAYKKQRRIEEEKRRAAEAKRRKEEEKRKKEREKRKERKEFETYLKLKAKYEAEGENR